jgi:heme/copper-type cytochrome/quinol oxidase subunit 3
VITNKRWIAISFWLFLALSITMGVRMAARMPQPSAFDARIIAIATALLIVASMQTGHSLARAQNGETSMSPFWTSLAISIGLAALLVFRVADAIDASGVLVMAANAGKNLSAGR